MYRHIYVYSQWYVVHVVSLYFHLHFSTWGILYRTYITVITMVNSSLRLGSLNVQGGLSNKLLLHELQILVKSFDIFVFVETWLTEYVDLCVDGYVYFRSDRIKNKRAKRGSGGVCTFIRK